MSRRSSSGRNNERPRWAGSLPPRKVPTWNIVPSVKPWRLQWDPPGRDATLPGWQADPGINQPGHRPLGPDCLANLTFPPSMSSPDVQWSAAFPRPQTTALDGSVQPGPRPSQDSRTPALGISGLKQLGKGQGAPKRARGHQCSTGGTISAGNHMIKTLHHVHQPLWSLT